MIAWYNKLPIVHKLRLLLMTSSLAVIVCFSAIYIYYGAHSLEVNLETETINSVNLTGSRNVAALRFNNPNFASTNLKALNADTSYKKICLYDAAAKLFASYPIAAVCPTLNLLQNGMVAELTGKANGAFFVQRNIIADGELVGVIWAERTQTAVAVYVHNQLQTMLVIALISLLLNYFVADYLQKNISRPIMAIAENAQSIAVEPMRHHRITDQYGDNELGKLAAAFNRILTNMEDRLKEVSGHNMDLVKAQDLTLLRIEALAKQFIESADAFYAFTEITGNSDAGLNKETYLAYQGDVAESLGLHGTNLESFLRISRLYAEALTTPCVIVNVAEYLAQFALKLKNTVPFLGIELVGNFGRQLLPIGVHKTAWDEIFTILSKLYITLVGLVEFSPGLKIEILSEPAQIYLVFGQTNNSTKQDASATLQQQFGDFEVGFDEISYKKNSIEDPEVADDFLDAELLHRTDLQYILDTIVYIANANAISITHRFEIGKFILCLEITKASQEAIEIERRLAIQ